MDKILITGSNGFIGSFLVDYFLTHGFQVFGIDRPASVPKIGRVDNYIFFPLDLPDPLLAEKLKEFSPDIIIHTAGNSSVPNSVVNPLGDFNGSVLVYFHLLEAVRKTIPNCKVISLSSAAVYGNPVKLPIDELSPAQPISPYGYHKLLCEQVSKEYFHLFNLKVCSARIFSAYGPGLKRQIVWDILEKARRNETILLGGTGKETRDFIFISDIAIALDLIRDKGLFESEVYNIASGQETTIQLLAELVLNSARLPKKVEFSGLQRAGDPLYWRADTKKICSLGFSPEINIAEGVQKFVDWVELSDMEKAKNRYG